MIYVFLNSVITALFFNKLFNDFDLHMDLLKIKE